MQFSEFSKIRTSLQASCTRYLLRQVQRQNECMGCLWRQWDYEEKIRQCARPRGVRRFKTWGLQRLINRTPHTKRTAYRIPKHLAIRMFFKSRQFLVGYAFAVALLVVSVTSSRLTRQKRSDDGGPLEAVVEQLTQQVTSLNAQLNSVNAEVTALKMKTGKKFCFF